MDELFTRDCQFSLATAKDNIPSVRVVDTYYDNQCFYLVTYGTSKKVKELEHNKHISLCNKLYNFSGFAYNIGWIFWRRKQRNFLLNLILLLRNKT